MEREMSESAQELKNVLQALALPVTGQVRLVVDDCARVERLARAFKAAHHAVRDEGAIALTPERDGALLLLDERLAQVSEQTPAPLCSELSMRQSPEWRQIRRMARETLVQFDWPLQVPSRASHAGLPFSMN
jgi:hypothetical protein